MLEYSEIREVFPDMYKIRPKYARLEDMQPTDGLMIKNEELYKTNHIKYDSNNNILDIVDLLIFYVSSGGPCEKNIIYNVINCMIDTNENKKNIISDDKKNSIIKGVDYKDYKNIEKTFYGLYNCVKRYKKSYYDEHRFYVDELDVKIKENIYKNYESQEILQNYESIPEILPEYTPYDMDYYEKLSSEIDFRTKLRIKDNKLIIDKRRFKSIKRKISGDSRWKILEFLKSQPYNKYINTILQKLSNGVYKDDENWKNFMNIHITSK